MLIKRFQGCLYNKNIFFSKLASIDFFHHYWKALIMINITIKALLIPVSKGTRVVVLTAIKINHMFSANYFFPIEKSKIKLVF